VDGSYIYDRIPSSADPTPASGGRHQMLYKKRPYDEKPAESSGAGGGPISKVGRSGQARSYSVNQVAPKGKVATLTRVGAGGHRTVLSWQDAPDDVFYRASPQTKKVAGGRCIWSKVEGLRVEGCRFGSMWVDP
jgi:hypothetical protein